MAADGDWREDQPSLELSELTGECRRLDYKRSAIIGKDHYGLIRSGDDKGPFK